jgi:hypothetical protein
MIQQEKLHLEAAAYADTQAKERSEQLLKNNMSQYDSLQEARLWVAAYEGYKEGRVAVANQKADVITLSAKRGQFISNKILEKTIEELKGAEPIMDGVIGTVNCYAKLIKQLEFGTDK